MEECAAEEAEQLAKEQVRKKAYYAYLSSRLGKVSYLFAKLVTLVYNVYISFGLGYCRLLIIPVNLYQVLDDPNSN